MFLYTTLYSMPLYNGRIVAILQSAQPWSATIALGAPHAQPNVGLEFDIKTRIWYTVENGYTENFSWSCIWTSAINGQKQIGRTNMVRRVFANNSERRNAHPAQKGDGQSGGEAVWALETLETPTKDSLLHHKTHLSQSLINETHSARPTYTPLILARLEKLTNPRDCTTRLMLMWSYQLNDLSLSDLNWQSVKTDLVLRPLGGAVRYKKPPLLQTPLLVQPYFLPLLL